MIKYVMKKSSQSASGYISDINKTVNYSEYRKLLLDDWELCRKEYFIITPFFSWWNSFSTANKLMVVSIIVALTVPFTVWMLNYKFNEDYQNLKDNYKTLTEKYNLLYDTYILTTDTVYTLNNKIEHLKQSSPTKTFSDKKTSD